MIIKKKISKEDNDTWQNYIENLNDITDKDKNLNIDFSNNKRFKFDLHGYSLAKANDKVRELILSCVNGKFKEILLITGKGMHSNSDQDTYVSKDLSKLRFSVPEYIKSNSDLSKYVLSISSANKTDGGEGALIIKLRKIIE